MRLADLASLLVSLTLLGCSETSALLAPPQSTATTQEATTRLAPAPAAPAPQEAFRPRVQKPIAPPEELNFDYNEWLAIKDLPAISSDGSLIALIDATGFQERHGVGDTVRLLLLTTKDNNTAQRLDLLLPSETYSFDAEALAKTQASLVEKVAPRIEAAQQVLDANTWLPLHELGKSGASFEQKSPEPIKVTFEEEKLHLKISVNGKLFKDQKFPKWQAPKAKPCKAKDPVLGCGCEYPLALQEVLYNAELRLFWLSFEYRTTRQCKTPPAKRTLVVQPKAKPKKPTSKG